MVWWRSGRARADPTATVGSRHAVAVGETASALARAGSLSRCRSPRRGRRGASRLDEWSLSWATGLEMSESGPCLVRKIFKDSPSHRILRHMHGALNIHENKNYLHSSSVNREMNFFEPSYSIIEQCLSNKNESATVPFFISFCQLNKA